MENSIDLVFQLIFFHILNFFKSNLQNWLEKKPKRPSSDRAETEKSSTEAETRTVVEKEKPSQDESVVQSSIANIEESGESSSTTNDQRT